MSYKQYFLLFYCCIMRTRYPQQKILSDMLRCFSTSHKEKSRWHLMFDKRLWAIWIIDTSVDSERNFHTYSIVEFCSFIYSRRRWKEKWVIMFLWSSWYPCKKEEMTAIMKNILSNSSIVSILLFCPPIIVKQ